MVLVSRCLTCPAGGCQPASVVKGVRARVEGNGFARGRPALLWSTARGWLPVGDKMFDGVIPLGEAFGRSIFSRPYTRACRQQQ